jgi:hypothetical protein
LFVRTGQKVTSPVTFLASALNMDRQVVNGDSTMTLNAIAPWAVLAAYCAVTWWVTGLPHNWGASSHSRFGAEIGFQEMSEVPNAKPTKSSLSNHQKTGRL